jgi:hypothetical protein
MLEVVDVETRSPWRGAAAAALQVVAPLPLDGDAGQFNVARDPLHRSQRAPVE